jgi:tetratricopeptide (TPR) repeat protein
VKIKNIELIARTGWDIAAAYVISGQCLNSSRVAQKVIVLLEKTNTVHEDFGAGLNVYGVLHGYHGWGMGWSGNFREGKAILEKGVHTTSQINDRTGAGLLEWIYGLFFCAKGDGKNAIDHFEKSIRYIEEVKYIIISGLAWSGLGWGHYLRGDLEAAQSYIEKGLKIHSDAGVFWLSLHFLLLGMLNFDFGDLKTAQNSIQEALTLSQNKKEKQYEAYARLWLGRIIGKRDTPQSNKAEEHILQGIKAMDELKLRPFSAQGRLFLGELHNDKGKSEKALENLRKAEEMFQAMGMDYWLTKTREVLGRL